MNLARFAHNDNCCSVRCELIKLVQDELTILRMLSLRIYAKLKEMNEQCAIGFVDETPRSRNFSFLGGSIFFFFPTTADNHGKNVFSV